MRDVATVLRAPGALNAAELRRRLAREGRARARPVADEAVEFLDTFDDRLGRAGLALARDDRRLLVYNARTGALLAACPWRRRPAPRTANDIPAGDVREQVAPIIEPRALRFRFRARLLRREIDVTWPDGGEPARVRWERASVATDEMRGEVVLIVVDGVRPRHRGALRRGFAGTGARVVPEGWYAQLKHTAGLRDGYSPRPRVNVAADATLRALAAGVFLHLLGVMEANETGVRDDVDPEFLHDFRVAVRRTRTALSQMKGVLPAESVRDIRARFAEVARACGPLRDLDVHLMQREDYRTLVPGGLRSDLDDVFARLAQEREREQRAVVAVIDGASYRRLKRDWRGTIRTLRSGPPLGLDAEEPAVRVGRDVILRRYERIREHLASAAADDNATLHRVRVECKKLRYALEFFAPLIGGADDTLAQLERIQDALGEYNDLVVQEARLGALLKSESPGAPGVVGRAAAIGAALAGLERRRAKARERCVDRLAELTGRRFSRSLKKITDDHDPDRRNE